MALSLVALYSRFETAQAHLDTAETICGSKPLCSIEAVEPIMDMPNLPVARVMWRAYPDLCTGAKLWILAGGAHHTVLSYDATAEMLEDWADMMGIEYIHIGKETTVESLKNKLIWNDLAWKLR